MPEEKDTPLALLNINSNSSFWRLRSEHASSVCKMYIYTQCTNRTVPYGIHIDNLKVQMSTSGVDPLEIDFDSLRPGIKKAF